MIIRGAMGRKMPFGKVIVDDVLYFAENNGEGLIKAKATVIHVYNSCQLNVDESKQMVDSFNNRLMLDSGLKKRFRGKRYLVLITIKDFEDIEPFPFNRSKYGNMDDWLAVGEINQVLF
jgi:hypothetical protein